ncbi:hypothetical protein Q9R46_21310 [Paenibacillus sp. RRE4]|uniref:hypothetical protein n=1 Tax=Paenibacillus sp. RRE4 TaxID=2962587 RepID=UPI00288284CA|nr:hypothetical protein [Paenibacillus sp. RRE4]MDT0125218.1 hypothetical protein [Paenibacillus sp. RRE4]
MDAWKQAWWLTRNEYRKDKLQWLWSAVFMIYTGSMSGVLLIGQEQSDFINPVVDAFFLIMLPLQGFLFSRRSFRYIQEDSYTQMLAYYRRLPIPNETVMWSRLQQALIGFVYNGLFFYGSLYAVRLHTLDFTWDQYLAFALSCTGYGLLITGLYIYGEFLLSGKKYLLLSFMFLPIGIVTSILIRFSGNYGFWYVIQYSKWWGLLSPVMWIAVVAGLATLWVVSRSTLKKLALRDLS